MAEKSPDGVRIGKFDILATYTLARGLRDGLSEGEARERGMVAAVMGAKARLGRKGSRPEDDYEADRRAAERKKSITAESFNKQVAARMGRFFEEVFLPVMKKLIADGLSYDEVKATLKVPRTWGAKITGEAFKERAASYFKKRGPA